MICVMVNDTEFWINVLFATVFMSVKSASLCCKNNISTSISIKTIFYAEPHSLAGILALFLNCLVGLLNFNSWLVTNPGRKLESL